MTDRPPHPIYRRRRALVIGLVGFLAEQDDPVPWDDVLVTFTTGKLSWKTLENVIRELEAFGAIHRIGKVVKGRDTRALLATPLGRAWLEGDTMPLPGDHHDPDADEIPDDPFALADAIADVRAELEDLDLENPLA